MTDANPATATVPSEPAGRSVLDRGLLARRALPPSTSIAVVVIGLLIFAAFAVTTSGFLTTASGKAILVSASVVGILAVGQTVVMISGNLFSLSAAMIAAVSGMAFMYSLQYGLAVAILAAFFVGIVLNVIQGAIIGTWRANPIIVTIAAAGLIEGVARMISGNRNVMPPRGYEAHKFLTDSILGIPVSVYVFAGVALFVGLILRRTTLGLKLYFAGDSRPAARAAGLRVGRLTVAAFAIAGVGAGAAGMIMSTIATHGQANLAGNLTFDAIAATLVGGTAVFGGKGSVQRTVLGALAIAAITHLALVRGYTTGVQILLTGVLVLVAVLLVQLTSRESKTG